MRLCASGRRQNAARDERHIDGCDGTTQSFSNANASSSRSLPIGCFVCLQSKRKGGKKEERTAETPSKKGMGRRNLALTGLHSLKIKLVHHTRSHTHTHIYTQALFSSFSCPVQILFVQPHPHLAPTKTYPTRIRDKAWKIANHSLPCPFLWFYQHPFWHCKQPKRFQLNQLHTGVSLFNCWKKKELTNWNFSVGTPSEWKLTTKRSK